MLVKEIIQSGKVHTISGDVTVLEAANIMTKLDIGALIIGIPEKIEGIFSERDILEKVIGKNLTPENTRVKDVMSNNITVVEESESAYIALNIMQKKKFRHLPVVNASGVCLGMLGIRSLMKSISENIQNENKILTSQIIDEEDL